MTTIVNLEEWVKHAMRAEYGARSWLRVEGDKGEIGEIYLRVRGGASVHGHLAGTTLDIATVVISRDKDQRQGHFKNMLAQVFDVCLTNKIDHVFIENVTVPGLAAWIDKQPGWEQSGLEYWDVPSYTYSFNGSKS